MSFTPIEIVIAAVETPEGELFVNMQFGEDDGTLTVDVPTAEAIAMNLFRTVQQCKEIQEKQQEGP